MAPRSTRGSSAKEAAVIMSSEKEDSRHHSVSPSVAPVASPVPSKKPSQLGKKPATGKATEPRVKAANTSAPRDSLKTESAEKLTTTRKRKRDVLPKVDDDTDELPHGLGKPWKANEGRTQAPNSSDSGPAKKEEDVKCEKDKVPSTKATEASTGIGKSLAKKSRKGKTNPYGLTPGMSPFPDWPHPTPEECQQVNDLLSNIHGIVKAPEKIPEPSATVAGCGEVPSVLDALIRTLLSAATSGTNSSRAFQGLIEEYGRKKTGIGKGSVDWDAVRHSDVSRVFNAIKSGGLADVKSKKIKLILDMVHEENQARRNALVKADQEPDTKKALAIAPKGAETESVEAKKTEIQAAEGDILSLDYLHTMPSQEAFNHMLKYPGIGVKTASCVTMFCLRRPSFAVDTHVFRLCQWLGWVPEKANRDTTFMHCEVMVPDQLKYSLHQLLIQHGKKCGRCRAITGESSEGWEKGCVIDHLVKRTGTRKGGTSPVKVKKNRKLGKGGQSDEDEDEDQDSDTDNVVGSNADAPARKMTLRVTPKKTQITSKEEDPEDSNEQQEEQESGQAESDFEPSTKKARFARPKKAVRVRKSGR
ncbi:MAG: hypothetical protein Q9176_004123 [Flavoplaca citrina]